MPNESTSDLPLRSGAETDGRATRRLRFIGWAFTSAWVINASVLLAAFAWTYFDGRSLAAFELLQTKVGFRSHQVVSTDSSAQTAARIVTTGVIVTTIVLGTMLSMFSGLFVGPQRFRSIRGWLLFTALAGGWLGFVMGWPEIYWRGQQHRMRAMLAPVESMARYLEANWPNEDGDLPGIGPYLAYPKGGPTTVLPLKWITFPETSLRFSEIERTKDGAIRFALTGSEAGAWLEWRPDDRPPAPFVSGLDTSYRIIRQERLAPQWFLVRYRPGPLGSTLRLQTVAEVCGPGRPS